MKRCAKPTKKVRKAKVSPSELIRSALGKCKKADLIDFLVEFSNEHLEVQRELETRLNVEKPVSLLVNGYVYSIPRLLWASFVGLNRSERFPPSPALAIQYIVHANRRSPRRVQKDHHQ